MVSLSSEYSSLPARVIYLGGKMGCNVMTPFFNFLFLCGCCTRLLICSGLARVERPTPHSLFTVYKHTAQLIPIIIWGYFPAPCVIM